MTESKARVGTSNVIATASELATEICHSDARLPRGARSATTANTPVIVSRAG